MQRFDMKKASTPGVQMHFLISSMSPLAVSKDQAKLSAPRTLDQVRC